MPDASLDIATYDFERLYTNISQSDLKLQLHWAVNEAFQVRGKIKNTRAGRVIVPAAAVTVYLHKGTPPKWHQTSNTATFTDTHNREWYKFSAAAACTIISLIIDNTFINFGSTAYWQRTGIPMGINPAVYFANIYLFCYELNFLQRLYKLASADDLSQPLATPLPAALTQHGGPLARLATPTTTFAFLAAVADAFAYTKRYVDDLASLMNALWPHLSYINQQVGPVYGVYPSTLNLKLATPDRQGMQPLPFLDLHITPSRRADGTIFLDICLYDKRREPNFAKLGIVRFPHATSALSTACKLNIITSRYHFFRTVLTRRDNFCAEVATVILDFHKRQYNLARLWHKLAHLLRRYPAFPPSNWRSLFDSIRSSYEATLAATTVTD